MKAKSLVLSAALMLTASSALMAQQPQPLPLDPEVRTGVLDNGLTYYLRHNNWPEGRTSFFIAQRVGSCQEEESQLGLAHFLEHMCFNGTEHFPGNEVWNFVQRNGINNNAETAFDRTLYHIDNVPSTIGSAGMDSCLLILADWAHALTLDENEIEKERDVIHGEYRMRMQGANRILLEELPGLYPGRYGARFPIGKMEVVDNFEHKELVDYYHKWYNPENQAVIVVGDIDVDAYEQKVRDLFSGFQTYANAGKVEEYHIDDLPEVYYSIAKDKDLNAGLLRYNVAIPELPRAMRNTAQAQLINFVLEAASSALGYRFQDLVTSPDCPFMLGMASRGNIVSPKFDQFNVECYPKEGQQLATYQLMITELRRLVQYGLTQSEYDRFLQEYGQQTDDYEANKDKRDNSVLATQLAFSFFYGHSFLAPDMNLMLRRQFAQALPVENLNQMLSQLICTTGQNSTLWSWETEKEGAVHATREQLQQAFQQAQAAQIEAPVDNSIREPLVSALPAPGSIVAEEESRFDYRKLTLSNGVEVYIRQSQVEPNTISIKAWSWAGSDMYEADEFINFDSADEVPVAVGGWNSRQLQKLLAGKKVNARYSLYNNHRYVQGTAGTKDLESLMQLAYLYFTNISRDDEMYPIILDQLRTVLPNRKHNSDAIFSDSCTVVLFDHSPRNGLFEVEDIEKLDYDRMIEMLCEPMGNAANFKFAVTGDFDEAQLREFLCQYIASLPSKGVADSFRRVADPELTKKTVCDFKAPMSEPKVLSQTHWINKKMDASPENVIISGLVQRMLNNLHFRVIREEMSACYTPYCRRDFELQPEEHSISFLASHTGLKPELADQALAFTSQSIIDLSNKCTAEELVKAQEEFVNAVREARDTRLGFYENAIINWVDYGYDSTSIIEEVCKAQTPATIQQWLQQFLMDAVEVQIIARPE